MNPSPPASRLRPQRSSIFAAPRLSDGPARRRHPLSSTPSPARVSLCPPGLALREETLPHSVERRIELRHDPRPQTQSTSGEDATAAA